MAKVLFAVGMVILILSSALQVVRSVPPPLIRQSEAGIKFLWDSVDKGEFWNHIPGHPSTDSAWIGFLRDEGQFQVNNYYSRRFQTNEDDASLNGKSFALSMVRYERNAIHKFNPRENTYVRALAKLLISQFAKVRNKEAVVGQGHRLSDDLARIRQEEEARRAELAARNRDWGRDLSLSSWRGHEGEQQMSEGGPSESLR
ncbi:uncharacterized protein UBRO_20041 [Ustilago bromivora]|nr:uncharacterized protein UBRO_20041 [Ustilago bromivora]